MSQHITLSSGVGELVTNIPAMLGYVPTEHLILLVETDGNGQSSRIGPVVVVDIDEDTPRSCIGAFRAIGDGCKQAKLTITRINVIVVSDNEKVREAAKQFASEFLTGQLGDLGVIVDGPLWVERFGQGEKVRGIHRDEFITDTLGDHLGSAVAASNAVQPGRGIYPNQQQWRDNGGPAARAEDQRLAAVRSSVQATEDGEDQD